MWDGTTEVPQVQCTSWHTYNSAAFDLGYLAHCGPHCTGSSCDHQGFPWLWAAYLQKAIVRCSPVERKGGEESWVATLIRHTDHMASGLTLAYQGYQQLWKRGDLWRDQPCGLLVGTAEECSLQQWYVSSSQHSRQPPHQQCS